MRDTRVLKEEYKQYTLGLALFDIVPVLLFLLSGLILWSMYGKPLFLAGVIASFIGGMCKVLWKLIVVVRKSDTRWMTTAFHILLPGGFVLMLLSAVIDVCRDSLAGVPLGDGRTLTGILKGLSVMPAPLLFAAGAIGICLMGFLASRLDESKGANWIEEIINSVSQLAILAGVLVVYFGMFYPAADTAAAALAGTDSVRVTAVNGNFTEVSSGDGNFSAGSAILAGKALNPRTYCFDGPGTDTALIFYPGAKVETTAYAPLMLRLADKGIDCYLCVMPCNFALFDRSAAEDIRKAAGDDYEHWYLCGHSLGGVAASMMLADEASRSDGADDTENTDGTGGQPELWDGIIFLGSYPADKIHIPALSVYGSNDTVLNHMKYAQVGTNRLWPKDFTEKVIRGGNHAYFGDYGEQKGDGKAAITADAQREETAEAICSFAHK